MIKQTVNVSLNEYVDNILKNMEKDAVQCNAGFYLIGRIGNSLELSPDLPQATDDELIRNVTDSAKHFTTKYLPKLDLAAPGFTLKINRTRKG